jgi:hypothetical protein
MKRGSNIHWTMVFIAAWATALPPIGNGAEKMVTPVSTLPELAVRDVVLDGQGVLHGTLTSSQGQPQGSTEVVVRRGGATVLTTKTQADGGFIVRDLRPGLYEINTDRSCGLYRVWAPQSAPPAAQQAALIVQRTTVIRAQEWNAWRRALILGGVIITSGVIGGVIGYNIKDDDAS